MYILVKLRWTLGAPEVNKTFLFIGCVLLPEVKGSGQWDGRGCRRSRNHYMLVGEVVLDVFLSFLWATILCEQLFIVPLVKQKRIVFAANNSRCCKCLVAPTIIWSGINGRFFATQNHKKMRENILLLTLEALTSRCYQHWQHRLFGANYA